MLSNASVYKGSLCKPSGLFTEALLSPLLNMTLLRPTPTHLISDTSPWKHDEIKGWER